MSRDSFINRDQNHGTPSHRRAPNQEKDWAKRSGGKLVPGSGCSYQKGDVKGAFGHFRIECKTTKKKSFSVTRDMIKKVEEAGLPSGEAPVLIIEFLDEQGNPEMEIAVLPTYVLEGIAEHAKKS
ncbi:MAG: hypothetical protein KAJ73_00555 [Zetaproteobacteria bacterium]|nr:hypothetical protein [Zetaproteobacteria bacterium]